MSTSPSQPHDPEHARLVEAALCGELAANAPQLAELRASCARCARELDELARVQRELDEEARSEAEALLAERAAAQRGSGVGSLPGARELEDYARARLAEARRRQAGPRRGARGRGWALAAALLLFGALAWYAWTIGRRPAPVEAPDPRLGTGASALRLLAPQGEVERFERFEWQGQLAEGDWYELTIRAEGAAPGAPPLLGPLRLQTNSYTLADLALPDAIRWEIEQFDASRAPRGSAAAQARRRSR